MPSHVPAARRGRGPPKEAAMKYRVLSLLGLGLCFASAPLHAHIKLNNPPDWIVTSAGGDPQKMSPCGAAGGARTNIVTKVRPGAKLMVRWTETTPHPGHFRLALAADRAEFVDPTYTTANMRCATVQTQATPVAPVIADNVHPHNTVPDNTQWMYEITVPNTEC